MGEVSDKAKGRIKEAAGALTDDDDLKNEGKLDQAAGKMKETARRAIDRVKDAVSNDRGNAGKR